MAYLAPQTLTCPVCAKTGEITWVVGIGPHTKKKAMAHPIRHS